MHPSKYKSYILFFLIMVFFCGCAKESLPTTDPGKEVILVSIAPYKYFVHKIVGDRFDIETIVPPGVSAHSYEPTPKETSKLQNAAIWFQIGEMFEKKISSTLQQKNPHLTLFDLRKTVTLIPLDHDTHFVGHHCKHCSHDALDTHIWLSPRLAIEQVKAMTEALAKRFPQFAGVFHENGEMFQDQLRQLDAEVRATLEPIHRRVILVSHPAFGYFCREYDCEQISVEYEGKDPLPKYLESILKKVKSEHIEVVFLLPQYNNKGAQLIANQLQVPAVMIDPYSENYSETLREMAQAIAHPGQEL